MTFSLSDDVMVLRWMGVEGPAFDPTPADNKLKLT